MPLMVPSALVMPKSAGLRKAPAATNTAAMPTSEWNAATSCGIAVISMRLAITKPAAPPMAMATRIRA